MISGWAKQTRSKGFTIVELLVVIVVIVILAAITVVAYNGIQARAQNTQFLAAFDAYEKALRVYHATHGHWPEPELFQTAGSGLRGATVCLGNVEQYPATADFNEGACTALCIGGECSTFGPGTIAGTDETLTNDLREVMGAQPTFAANREVVVRVNDPTFGDSMSGARGIRYFYCRPEVSCNEGTSINFGVSGDSECGRGTKQQQEVAEGIYMTLCSVVLEE